MSSNEISSKFGSICYFLLAAQSYSAHRMDS